jgi:hypothetical protein
MKTNSSSTIHPLPREKRVSCEWREDKRHLGRNSSFSAWRPFDGGEEYLPTNSHRLVDEFFKLSMVVDGLTAQFGLFGRQSDCNGLGFDFASPAPVALWVLGQAALSHPIEG